MNNTRKLALLAIAAAATLTLAGCAGNQARSPDFQNLGQDSFRYDNKAVMITDLPDESRMLIVKTQATIAQLRQEMRHWGEETIGAIAESWLRDQGRNCRVRENDVNFIIDSEIEVKYRC